MKHKHHIIPKHAGGTDDASNIVELTVPEHAEAHKKLWELYGRDEDFVAWQGLSKMIGKEEIIRQVQSLAGKKRMRLHGNPGKGKKIGGNFAINKVNQEKAEKLAHSPQASKKRKQSYENIKHQQGHKNSQFGTKWCILETAKDLTDRKKFSIIPEGYITTTEWKERKKDKSNAAYGRHWYNDGSKNYYLKEFDPLVEKLTKGRLMIVN
jgi:hypothetical protein